MDEFNRESMEDKQSKDMYEEGNIDNSQNEQSRPRVSFLFKTVITAGTMLAVAIVGMWMLQMHPADNQIAFSKVQEKSWNGISGGEAKVQKMSNERMSYQEMPTQSWTLAEYADYTGWDVRELKEESIEAVPGNNSNITEIRGRFLYRGKLDDVELQVIEHDQMDAQAYIEGEPVAIGEQQVYFSHDADSYYAYYQSGSEQYLVFVHKADVPEEKYFSDMMKDLFE